MSSSLMDGLNMILLLLLGLVSCSHHFIPPSVLEVTVRPGDNVTLYCDCKVDLGVYIVWYRNCSHQNQPSLLLDFNTDFYQKKSFPHYHFEKNFSSDSYNLMIMNVTVSDEGLYYCGTKETKVDDFYKYGNITTRLTVNSSDPDFQKTPEDCHFCWVLLFSLCPVLSVLSALISSLLVYQLCQKTAKISLNGNRCDSVRQTGETQGEDVCYAALEISRPSNRSKKKRTNQRSDLSTYSVVSKSQDFSV